MTCSSESLDLPLAGSAPQAQGWLVLESLDTWPSHAVEAYVEPNVLAWAVERNLKTLLARHRENPPRENKLRYWVSDPQTGLHMGTRTSAAEVPDTESTIPADPLLLICTNGKRDQCCAVEGRRLMDQLKRSVSELQYSSIWECTHLGGHRFAPTALYLPDNLVLGRLTLDGARTLLDSGSIDNRFIRGRSHETPCRQLINTYLHRASYIDRETQPRQCSAEDHTHYVEFDNIRCEFLMSQHEFGPARKSCAAESGITSHVKIERVIQRST